MPALRRYVRKRWRTPVVRDSKKVPPRFSTTTDHFFVREDRLGKAGGVVGQGNQPRDPDGYESIEIKAEEIEIKDEVSLNDIY
jgi:hypothetical protein